MKVKPIQSMTEVLSATFILFCCHDRVSLSIVRPKTRHTMRAITHPSLSTRFLAGAIYHHCIGPATRTAFTALGTETG